MAAKGERDASGFSIVEVIIAMFLLAIISIAILPALFQGVRYSSEQSAVATSTRFLNDLVEEAREATTCAELGLIETPKTVQDGRGADLVGQGSVAQCPAPAGKAASVVITVTSGDRTLASTTALVYIP